MLDDNQACIPLWFPSGVDETKRQQMIKARTKNSVDSSSLRCCEVQRDLANLCWAVFFDRNTVMI